MNCKPNNDLPPSYLFRWVCVGSFGFWLVHFLLGVLLLISSTGDFTSAHGVEAREHYLGFIVLNHLKLLKAYVPVSYTHLTLPTNREV